MNKEVKIVLLGDSGVGKSSIVLRFCMNEFKLGYETTVGAAFMSKTIITKDNRSLKLQIWDTAGQEKYKALTPLYYRDAQVAILVYDITNKKSFQVLKSWVDELNEKGPRRLIKVIVGNKQDLLDSEQVSYGDVSDYAKQLGVILKLTSCKDNKGIQEMFQAIGEQVIQEESNVISVAQPKEQTSKNVKLEEPKAQKKGGSCC